MGIRVMKLGMRVLGDAIVTAFQPINLDWRPPLPKDTAVVSCRIDLLSSYLELRLRSAAWSEDDNEASLFCQANRGSTEEGAPVTILVIREQQGG